MKHIHTILVIFAVLTGALPAADLPRFAVISDIHIENKVGEWAKVKVPRALKNLLSKTPTVDAVFVVGDLTQSAKPEEFDRVAAMFADKTLVPEGIRPYFLLGNHDTGSGGKAIPLFSEKLKQPIHQYIEIKGYPFITVSMNDNNWKNPNSYTEESQLFLKEKLADAAAKYAGKPVFVFIHVPPKDTCYGSVRWGIEKFKGILNQYPQAVVFSGHSHLPVGDPRSIHQDKFTAINDGSTTYSGVEEYEKLTIGIHPENNEKVTEGLILTVLDSGSVDIERWDTCRNEKILPNWTLAAPHDGSQFHYKNRNGLPAPAFAEDAKIAVKRTGEKEVAVTFPQAADNEVVHNYLVEVVKDGKTAASNRTFSQFYLNSDMPKTLTVKFKDLPAALPYQISVRAVDSFGNQSEPISAAGL
ncbi:MAG: metallophosphoesterase [Planctomycetaceae bacterium]|jgi:predicted phosphodiesterase|nr:metallophosphoesterase [Planctomycetaceae bacterium]